MKPPLFVRTLTPEEDTALGEAARSDDAFARRRATVLRLSAQQRRVDEIADALAISPSGVRLIVHDFHGRGLASLSRRPMGPEASERVFDAATSERLVALAHQSPRAFDKPRSSWTRSGCWPRSPSRRGSPCARSRARRSARPSARSGTPGSGPRGGSGVRTRSTR